MLDRNCVLSLFEIILVHCGTHQCFVVFDGGQYCLGTWDTLSKGAVGRTDCGSRTTGCGFFTLEQLVVATPREPVSAVAIRLATPARWDHRAWRGGRRSHIGSSTLPVEAQ